MREAAERRGEDLTDFVLRSACTEAELTLSDKPNFVLSPEKWRMFLEALDRPPVVKPELQRLFSTPTILEKAR